MGRSRNVDDVHVGIMDKVPPVMVGLELCPESFLSSLQGIVKMLLVDIADCHEAAALIADEMKVAHADASDADDSSGHLVARSNELA